MAEREPSAIASHFSVDRDRSRDCRVEDPVLAVSPTKWLDLAAGARYARCTLDNFEVSGEESEAKERAVSLCRDYVANFPSHFKAGRGAIWIGPKGTGKDHLMIAVMRAIAMKYKSERLRYRSGEAFFDTFKASIGTGGSYASIADGFARPPVLGLSDPLPVKGDLSPHDQDVLFRVLLRRYKDLLPTLATLNVASAEELEQRMGAQSADRLRQDAIIIKCNWPSYRTNHGGN